MNLPEIPPAARQAIIQGVYAGHPTSNLEQLGLSTRILGLLENSPYQIVTLEDLVSRSRNDILSIQSLGEKSLECILDCLARYDELQQQPGVFPETHDSPMSQLSGMTHA